MSALHSYPMAKMDPAFDVTSGHVAMSFASFERFERASNASSHHWSRWLHRNPNLIELCLPPAVVLVVTLNGDPLAERIAVLLVITGNGAMPLTLYKRMKGGNALILSFFGKQPSALSNH